MKNEEYEKCIKCDKDVFLKETEVYGELVEVGAFCDNDKCERYKILVV